MRKTARDILEVKKSGGSLTMLTAYDATMASLLAQCDVDMILVGDSLAMVVQGQDSTVSVTMDEMVYHSKLVRRGAPDKFMISDMPFGSHELGYEQAITNGHRFLKECGSDAVKLEGGKEVCDTVRRMVTAGISVMGHIGLTPQTASQLGGYKVQGRDVDSARKVLEDAKALQEAGAFAVLMECVPADIAGLITETLTIPTIGIGAGVHCDGQVLVTQDMLGMFEKFTPKFVKQYTALASSIKEGVSTYCAEVRGRQFPAGVHSFSVAPDVIEQLKP